MNLVQVLTAEWTLSMGMGMDAGCINVIAIQTRLAFSNPNPIDENPIAKMQNWENETHPFRWLEFGM